MLHLLNYHWKWSAIFEVMEQYDTIFLFVYTSSFPHRDRIVPGNCVRFITGNLIVELSKHNLLHILKLFLLSLDRNSVCCNGPIYLKLNICDHFLTWWVIDCKSDHGLRILASSRLQKLAFDLCISFFDDAKNTANFAFSLDTDRACFCRIKLS